MGRKFVAALAVSAVFAGFSANASTLRPVSCSDNSGTDQGTLDTAINAAVPGDVIAITGLCAGDFLVRGNGITFSNENATTSSTTPAYVSTDGIDGMVEVYGAQRDIFSGIALHGSHLSSSNTSSAPGSVFSEIANLLVHDAASATLINSTISNSAVAGLWATRASAVSVLNTTISGNGNAATNIYANGIVAQDGSAIQLGKPNGTSGSTVTGNGVSTGTCQGFGISLSQSSSLDAFNSTIGTTGSPNGCGQVYLITSSSARMVGTSIVQPSNWTYGAAVRAYAGSSVILDTNYSDSAVPHTISTVNGGGAGAILLAAASSAVLGGSTIQSSGSSQPTIEGSTSSTVVLIGGNTIANSNATGTAIQVDHSSSLVQQKGNQFGDPIQADSVSGAGSVQVQSSIDLGVGLISSAPSIVWTLSGSQIINVQQNSSFRLSGGITISGGGGVKIQQGSNAFFNVNNGGTNTATVTCTNSANNPMAHVANPGSVSSVTTYNLNDVLTGDSAATHAGQTNACLNF